MKALTVGLATVVILATGEAFADIGEQGQLAVGAERLTGFTHSSESSESDAGKTSTTYNTFSLLGMPLAGFVTSYSIPRIGVDYFATDGLSVGGSLMFMRVGFSTEYEPAMGPSMESGSSTNVWLFSPRVGYAYMFTDSIGIWPRGGLTYLRTSSSDDDDDSGSTTSAWALSIEAPFLFAAAENIAFTAGPTIDLGLSYSGENTDADGNTVEDEDTNPPHEFGLQAGITVFF